jgi:hypothetical protein
MELGFPQGNQGPQEKPNMTKTRTTMNSNRRPHRPHQNSTTYSMKKNCCSKKKMTN